MPMTPEQYTTARSSYRYVPARLVLAKQDQSPDLPLTWGQVKMSGYCPSTVEWKTPDTRAKHASTKLDQGHTDLLNSEREDDLLQGLASTLFWGYASGTTGVHNPKRALAKAKMLCDGRQGAVVQNVMEVLEHLRQARNKLQHETPGAALGEAMKIKFLGMSFASKVIMFLDPARAVVYDSVIANLLKTSAEPELRNMAVSPSAATPRLRQMNAYDRWCDFCVNKANELHALGSRWTDWDGIKSEWRAVDVERAFFAGV